MITTVYTFRCYGTRDPLKLAKLMAIFILISFGYRSGIADGINSYALPMVEAKEIPWTKLRDGKTYRHPVTKETIDHLYLRIHYPIGWEASDRRPAVVFAYGSSWGGYAMQDAKEIRQANNQAKDLSTREGAVQVSFQYRPGLKVSMQDAAAAIRWTRKNHRELGIDPNRIIGMGGSSGGQMIAGATFLKDGPIAPWDDPKISDECQLNLGFVAVLSRPETPELSPAHNLRNDLPPFWMTMGTADQAFGKYMQAFIDSAQNYHFPFHKYVAVGYGHGYKYGTEGRARSDRESRDFCFAYGGFDYKVWKETGARIKLDTMGHFFDLMGLGRGVKFTVDKGGTIEGNEFVDDGVPGISRVTATSVKDSRIYRHAYMLIGTSVWAEDSQSITKTGQWKRVEKEKDGDRPGFDSVFHNVYYYTTEKDESTRFTFSQKLPKGSYVALSFKPQIPYFVQPDIHTLIEDKNGVQEFSLQVSQQNRNWYPLPIVESNGQDPIKVTFTAKNNIKPGNLNRTILANAVAFYPRYTGGEKLLAYTDGAGNVIKPKAVYGEKPVSIFEGFFEQRLGQEPNRQLKILVTPRHQLPSRKNLKTFKINGGY